jgi:hypothetical protein
MNGKSARALLFCAVFRRSTNLRLTRPMRVVAPIFGARLTALAAQCVAIAMLSFSSQIVRADEVADVQKLLASSKNVEALQKADQFLTAKPRDPMMRFLRGISLSQAGRNAEAITAFQKLTEDYPELPEPFNNLAVLYAQQGQYDKSRTALEMAIRTNPSYATAYENLAPKPVVTPPAPTPAPASAPAPVEAKAEAQEREVESAVRAWAAAWARKDMDGYFAAYARDFDAGKSRKAWEQERRERISSKRSISVKLSDINVKISGAKATVHFRQDYKADSLSVSSGKRLDLVRAGAAWVIVKETSGS